MPKRKASNGRGRACSEPRPECVLLVGQPGTGKTYRACGEWAQYRMVPRLALDTVGSVAQTLGAVPVMDLFSAARDAAAGRLSCYQPRNSGDVVRWVAWVMRCRRSAVLVDEAGVWRRELSPLWRMWRHCGHRVWMTTQSVSRDVGQLGLECASAVVCGRVASPAGLRVIRDCWGRGAAERVRGLRDREFVSLREVKL